MSSVIVAKAPVEKSEERRRECIALLLYTYIHHLGRAYAFKSRFYVAAVCIDGFR